MERRRPISIGIALTFISLLSSAALAGDGAATRPVPSEPSDFSALDVVVNVGSHIYEGDLFVDGTKQRIRFDVEARGRRPAHSIFAFWDKQLVYVYTGHDDTCERSRGMDAFLKVFPTQAEGFDPNFLFAPWTADGVPPFDLELQGKRTVVAQGNTGTARRVVVERWKRRIERGVVFQVGLQPGDASNVPYYVIWHTPKVRFKLVNFGQWTPGAPDASTFNLPATCVG